jgi:hypothetical protein
MQVEPAKGSGCWCLLEKVAMYLDSWQDEGEISAFGREKSHSWAVRIVIGRSTAAL